MSGVASLTGALRRLRDARGDPGPDDGAARDMTPAVGTPGGPASWRRPVPGAGVALHRDRWADARWSSIFRRGSEYATDEPVAPGAVAEANLRGRRGDPPAVVQGPVMKAAVWTWEVPLYFWFGGMAAGATFVAVGCDVAGDERSGTIARRVALGALAPSPLLLVFDLGRPERFYNMLRIFKPRSPMSMGSWCLTVFGGLASLSVGADLIRRPRWARAVTVVNVPVAAYLGAYTGILLASTAVPIWSRSRRLLGAIFISTATLTGAAATRLALSAAGTAPGHPTREALARIEDGAMATELILTAMNKRTLGPLGTALESGEARTWFTRAAVLARGGLVARAASRRVVVAEHVASACFMGAALCYRFAWVRSGHASATDDAAVARNARARVRRSDG